MSSKNKAKILFFDLENSPNLCYAWGKYDQNIIRFEQEFYLMSFSWKWYGESKTHCLALPDFPGYAKNPTCDKALCKKLWELFDEADITIGHNIKKFDHGKANSRFIYHGMLPHSPVKKIDTLLVARRFFNFNCNKLDSLCRLLGIGSKVRHTGADLWFDCMKGDEKAWQLMKRYNKTDVILVEQLYERLRPYSDDNVHVGLFEENPLTRCPCCSSINLIRRGYRVASTRTYRQFVCNDCGRWSRSVMCEKDKKADIR